MENTLEDNQIEIQGLESKAIPKVLRKCRLKEITKSQTIASVLCPH